jgi:glycosyltransferase involved in cell wall biosynthesis
MKVSVIIPVYNGAAYLSDTIQSVLNQTHQNFELIIVDDASQDKTADIIGQFDDPRIRYIVHEENRGVDIARLSALRNATGDIFAFLDQDDLFHPDKLAAHVALMKKRPEVGFSYNSRFELNHSSTTIRDIWRPPQEISLADLILGFPIAPSEMVFRRQWSSHLDLSKEPPLIHGGEYVITGRLFLSGCRFGSVDRALNYRRFHSLRKMSNLRIRCEAELAAQQRIFDDPRCPSEIIALRNEAFSNTYRIWSYYAFLQEETSLGQEFLQKAVSLNHFILDGQPANLLHFLLICSIDDEGQSHEEILKRIFAQLPPAMAHLSRNFDWAVARGYFLKGVRATIWGRSEDGRRHFEHAMRSGVTFDELLISQLTQSLLNYQIEYGDAATFDVIRALRPYLEKLGGRRIARQLVGCYTINRAFLDYHRGCYSQVVRRVTSAFVYSPGYITNRGATSILLRSIFRK